MDLKQTHHVKSERKNHKSAEYKNTEIKNHEIKEVAPGVFLPTAGINEKTRSVLPEECLELVAALERKLRRRRTQLLASRKLRQVHYDQGKLPEYLPETGPAIQDDWKVAEIPNDLLKRRVEITGPVNDAKMVINMLSRTAQGARADTAMLDFEDSMMPSWENVIDGIHNVIGAANADLSLVAPSGKVYQLDPGDMALPMVRVRGLHLNESNVIVDGAPVSAGLFDLAVCFYHTHETLTRKKKTPKYYIPKCEHYLEANWWNDLFVDLQKLCGRDVGTLRATFLIETLPAAFQMEEILYEIKDHAAGLNVGRWDKIFSDIKCLRTHKDRVSMDRANIDMSKLWMDNYAKKLIKVCHKRGAFAIGGMSAFTPGKDAKSRRAQTEKVVKDKAYEASIGHDGCWVSHPYFISHAMNCFSKSNQLDVLLEEFPDHPDLIMEGGGPRTLEGLRKNVRAGIAYMKGWEQGLGCVAWDGLMEDLATLEISRAQTWQWIFHGALLDDGKIVTRELVDQIFDQELAKILFELEETFEVHGTQLKALEDQFRQACAQAKSVFLRDELSEFLENSSPFAGSDESFEAIESVVEDQAAILEAPPERDAVHVSR